jgi:RNA polymerase sigma factor (sigma-70 family)
MSADSTPTNKFNLDEATQQFIRRKARQIAWQAGANPRDADDLEQEITVHVWKRLGKFDPSKAEEACFTRMLVKHATATVLRDRKRRMKQAIPTLTLALRAGETLDEPVDARSLGAAEKTALSFDVSALMDSLPPKLRQLAEQLTSHSLAAAARELGISRATAYTRRAALRQVFADAGLEQFLETRQTLCKRAE